MCHYQRKNAHPPLLCQSQRISNDNSAFNSDTWKAIAKDFSERCGYEKYKKEIIKIGLSTMDIV